MELCERVRKLRKEHLHMSQTEFGEHLGVSRSVINNVELDLLARPDQKLSLIKLMCKEFGVNEDWLLNGTGEMFVKPDAFSLDRFIKDRGASDLELEVLKAYFELDLEVRQMLVEHFKKHLNRPSHPETPEELEKEFPPVENGSQVG